MRHEKVEQVFLKALEHIVTHPQAVGEAIEALEQKFTLTTRLN